MDATDSDQVWLSAIVESRQRYCDPLPDQDKRIFTPAGQPTDRAVCSLWTVAATTTHGSRISAPLYRDEDVALLVEVDRLHGTANGLVVKKLFERAWRVHGDQRYRRLAGISVSHIYNLRKSKGYKSRRTAHLKTRAHKVRIGERRKPQPKGHPGYLRVDTVHQGDWDGHKGVYHINAVDQVTRFEAVVSAERISELYLIPALQQVFDTLPFEVLGFHSDNGCEYVNYRVAELLEKLRIEFTKSRARHSNDNALVECKNGHVLRKLLGHAHIPRQCAAELNEFHQRHLNRYVNYHRPCLFAQVEMDERGRQQRRYRYEDVQTPYEKLKFAGCGAIFEGGCDVCKTGCIRSSIQR